MVKKKLKLNKLNVRSETKFISYANRHFSVFKYLKPLFVYTTKSKMGSQLLLSSPSFHVQLWRGSEKAFNECLGVSNVFPTAAQV